jgi:TDG/mug DNA glycosylase family protein
MEKHNIPPLFNNKSRILILGSFPSVKSREARFFYGHPQNRFWKVVSTIYGVECPVTVEEKKKMLLSNGIAVWDVIASCEITGSSDSSIKNVVPNDLSVIIEAADIEKIFCNGTASYNLYRKYIENKIGIKAVKLPSTSPANAAWSLDKLIKAWQCIAE